MNSRSIFSYLVLNIHLKFQDSGYRALLEKGSAGDVLRRVPQVLPEMGKGRGKTTLSSFGDGSFCGQKLQCLVKTLKKLYMKLDKCVVRP